MTRMVNCIKLEKEAEGLQMAPYPGELGQRIFENVSKEAWGMWLQHQTMLINEYRLTPIVEIAMGLMSSVSLGQYIEQLLRHHQYDCRECRFL